FAKGGGEQSDPIRIGCGEPAGVRNEENIPVWSKNMTLNRGDHGFERMEPRVPSFSLVGMGVVVGRAAPVIGKKRDERIASMMLHEVHHLMGSGHDARLIEAKRAHRAFVGGDGEANTP